MKIPNPAIKPTRPVYTHRKAELLMEIILSSNHARADYLVGKLVEYANEPEVYDRLRQRVKNHITLTTENEHEPVRLYPPGEFQQMAAQRFPGAITFGLVGLSGPDRAITFTTGTRQFWFMAPDGYVGEVQKTRAEAQDAFDVYWKPVKNRT